MSVFFLAESLGKTIPELLWGKSSVLSNEEYTYWLAYFREKSRIQQEEAEKSGKKKTGRADMEFKKTMGSGRQQ